MLMNEVIIRKATKQDMDTLLQFEQGVIERERQIDMVINPGKINYYNLPEMIERNDVEIVVAETGNKPIGCGYARVTNAKHYFTNEQFAYLGFMYVLPEYRGRGINKKVIEYLKAWAEKQGLKELRLEVYVENIEAVKAYEKIGFSKNVLEMRWLIN
ncbi:MAG TPA: GNAT family N-acetyltransferase [Puia sp.]|nr:GNAT family N-acetyltransferase [Puia sp.]